MPGRRGNEWAVLLTLSLGFFMTLLDLTIVNIAIPDMRRALHASLAEIGWVINAYIIVLATAMITAGRLGDLRGRRTLFLGGVAVFTLASAAAGLSQNATELIAARVVQGFGAALLLPQTMAIIIAIFPGHRRGAALGVWGSVAGLATIAGPTLGGMLVTWLGWRWIFFVNIPVGVAAIVLASLVIPQVRTGRRESLDLPGMLIATAALVAITYGLVEGQSCNWGTVWSFISIPLILAVGVLLMVIFVLVQALRQDRPPLLPFSLFQDRNYALMSTVSVIISMGLVGMWLPMSIYLQTVLGFSPLKAGLTIAPSALVSGFTAPFAGRLADRGGKFLLVTGFALYAVGLAVIVLAASPTSRWHDLLPGYLIAGLGVGCTMSPMQTIATRNVSPRLAGAASGVMNTARQTGSALGSAIVLAILQNRLAAHESFITAMRAAIAVPVGFLLLAAFLCTAIRRGPTTQRIPAAAASRGPQAPARTAPEAWLQPPPPEPRRLGRPAPDPLLARSVREQQTGPGSGPLLARSVREQQTGPGSGPLLARSVREPSPEPRGARPDRPTRADRPAPPAREAKPPPPAAEPWLRPPAESKRRPRRKSVLPAPVAPAGPEASPASAPPLRPAAAAPPLTPAAAPPLTPAAAAPPRTPAAAPPLIPARAAPPLKPAAAAPPLTPAGAGPTRPPASPDRWHPWLLRVRHGADEAPRERRLTTFLYPLRNDLLDRARLKPGETVLDVGTGDGLIAFGALDRVGGTGRVIFSDISPDLLDRCREAVAAEGLLDRCDFRQASADRLAGVDDASVDVVTTRSVLIYVKDKAAALREFHRVLRPGGRAVLVEPIGQLPDEPGWFLGYDVRPVAAIAGKVRLFYAGLQPQTRGPKPGFDDRDLARFAERAGFREIHCKLRVTVQAARPPWPWGRFLRASPGPLLPPFGEVLGHLLDPEEAAAFTGYLRPLVESGAGHRRQALAGLAAIKA
jgi:EmrB/QacA subfamily drug resistance transporter